MTPILILNKRKVKVKSQVFGKLVLNVQSNVYVEEVWFNLKMLQLFSLSGEVFFPKVHDWSLDWEDRYGDNWFGTLTLYVSHPFEINEEDAIYAANCAMSELNIVINEVETNVGDMKVNDFSIDWTDVIPVLC
ncbi:hypothetical protein A616_16930 [Brevibacillus brevis X23]|nr:hypothetical protein A616_16930 [Brevibacillus brevis X23]